MIRFVFRVGCQEDSKPHWSSGLAGLTYYDRDCGNGGRSS